MSVGRAFCSIVDTESRLQPLIYAFAWSTHRATGVSRIKAALLQPFMALLLQAVWLNYDSVQTCFPSFWQCKAKHYCPIHLWWHHNEVLESIYKKRSARKKKSVESPWWVPFLHLMTAHRGGGGMGTNTPIIPEKGPQSFLSPPKWWSKGKPLRTPGGTKWLCVP